MDRSQRKDGSMTLLTQQTPFGREARSFDGKRVINYTVEGHVGVIEMDDPPANTYTHEMMRQIDEAILDARFDSDVEVIVLIGKGEKFFSAGANIAMLNAVTPEFKYMFCLHANETLSRLEQTPKLVIAALNGHTVGGGLEIAMAADIRIARQDAGKIGLPEVALGVLPGTGGTQRLARLVGKSRAIELMATGRTFSFEQALEWGIVSDIYEGDAAAFREQIMTYAKQFTTPNKAPMAVGHIKRAVQTGLELPLNDALALERELQSLLFKSEDAKEGIASYNEKRMARFKNK
jgi:enoyl-CoA hydratase/carnithine racemase